MMTATATIERHAIHGHQTPNGRPGANGQDDVNGQNGEKDNYDPQSWIEIDEAFRALAPPLSPSESTSLQGPKDGNDFVAACDVQIDLSDGSAIESGLFIVRLAHDCVLEDVGVMLEALFRLKEIHNIIDEDGRKSSPKKSWGNGEIFAVFAFYDGH